MSLMIARMSLLLMLMGVGVPLWAVEPAEDAVARIGERVISRALLDDAVSQALNATYYHRHMTSERRLELEREQIQELIRRELNILGALDRGMVLPETAAEQTRLTIEGRLGREAYEAALKNAGSTEKAHRRALAETLLAQQAYQVFVLAPAQVSDDEVRNAFDAAPDHWRMPASAHVLHILLNVDPEAGENGMALVRNQAQSLLEKLNNGENFGALAAEFSQDMYSIKGGDLGWIHRGSLVEALEKAVWEAEIGTLLGPIRSSVGFHLAKVLGRRAARPMEYPEVEPMVREQLKKQKLEAAEFAWFGPLRGKYPVVILDPALDVGN